MITETYKPDSDFSDYLDQSKSPKRGPLTVWASVLDKKYGLEVLRLKENTHHGIYTIFELESEKILSQENVILSYGAKFGPDISDVSIWQDMAIEIVDNL